MGDKTFTFTGLLEELEDEPNKEQVVTTVKVPRFEYARLIAAKAKLDVIEKVCGNMDAYQTKEFLRALFTSPTEEDAE